MPKNALIKKNENSIESSSERTLIHLSQQLNDSQINLEQIEKNMEQIRIKNRKNLIYDKNSGDFCDINRFHKSTTYYSIKERGNTLNQGNLNFGKKQIQIWDQHWKESQKRHEQLIAAICQQNSMLTSQILKDKNQKHPIDINFKDLSNWTALHHAAMHSSIIVMSLLLNNSDIDVNSLTNFNQTALHIASKANKQQNCFLLFDAGVCYDYKDNNGNTALHYAAELGYREVIKVLLENGVSSLIPNNINLTPIDLCRSQELLKLFKNSNNQEKEQNPFKYRTNLHYFVQNMIMNQNSINKTLNDKNKQANKHQQVPHKISANQRRQQKISEKKRERKKEEKITVSQFKFYRKLGQGSFGQVYLVTRGNSPKLYALKAIKKEKLGNSLMCYIKTQKNILSFIKHPFIVHLYFAFQNEKYLFLVMDYCEGGDMSQLLKRRIRLDQNLVRLYAAELVLALQALHQNKIIYRDMKPQNIVIDGQGHVLITDFGLSKKTQNIEFMNKSVCGTPSYMPLQILNNLQHNYMADWYSLGITLYEMYAGVIPYHAQTKAQLRLKLKNQKIKFLPNTSKNFKSLILELTNHNFKKRLGFINDAESIKKHPWFNSIQWTQVYERKLAVEKVHCKKQLGMQMKCKFVDNKDQKNRIPDWSQIV